MKTFIFREWTRPGPCFTAPDERGSADQNISSQPPLPATPHEETEDHLTGGAGAQRSDSDGAGGGHW